MTTTHDLGLPLIEAGQAQKHLTMNEALLMLDAHVQLSVLRRDLTEPPAAQDRDAFLVAPGSSGDWTGYDNQIALRRDDIWQFFAPSEGWRVWVVQDASLLVFTGGSWVPLEDHISELAHLEAFGLGASPDANNPFTARLNGALWTSLPVAEAGTGDLRVTLNKEGAANTGSVLFQSAFEGRAEIGLVGDTRLSLRTSPDGVQWRNDLTINEVTGDVAIPVGRLGVGMEAPSKDIDITAAVPEMRLSGTQHDADLTFKVAGEGNLTYRASTGDANWNFRLHPQDGVSASRYVFGQSTGSTGPTLLVLYNPDNSVQASISSNSMNSYVCRQGGSFGVGVNAPLDRLHVDGDVRGGSFRPESDGVHDLGAPDLRFDNVYAAGGVITTSDVRAKTDIREIDEDLIERVRAVPARVFRFRSAEAGRGTGKARLHIGYVAQEIAEALDARAGDDGSQIDQLPAFLCGSPETNAKGREAAGLLGLRYAEFLALRDEMHRRDILCLQDKMNKLTSRLEGIEAGSL